MVCKSFLLLHQFPFHCVDCILQCTKVFKFDVAPFPVFSFCCLCFWWPSKKLLPSAMSWSFPILSPRSFMILGLTCGSLSHSLIFVYGVRQSSFPSFALGNPGFLAPCVEDPFSCVWLSLLREGISKAARALLTDARRPNQPRKKSLSHMQLSLWASVSQSLLAFTASHGPDFALNHCSQFHLLTTGNQGCSICFSMTSETILHSIHNPEKSISFDKT